MADPDFIFVDGFDHYTAVGDASIGVQSLINREWGTNSSDTGHSDTLRAALNGPSTGAALYIFKTGGNTNSGPCGYGKGLPGNYARCLGGMTVTNNVPDACNGVAFYDGPTAQLSIGVNAAGQIEVRRGAFHLATLIATSTQTMNLSLPNCIEWDITFHNSTGIIKVWLNGVLTSLNLTGQDTCATANNYFNTVFIGWTYGSSSNARFIAVDHFYLLCYTASGGSETPYLTSPVVETTFPTSDNTAQFVVGPSVLGQDFRTTTATDAPGANQLALRQFVPEVNATLNSVGIVPTSTSVTAKFKAVLYADSAGAPGALVATGTEVTGCTANTALTLPFAAGQALTGGTAYWIGYITDTSIALWRYDSTSVVGQKKANTYASGAPNPAGAMTTAQPAWLIWGNMTGAAANYAQVNKREPTLLEYNSESTVGDEDFFGFSPLSVNPAAIHVVAVRVAAVKSDGGARTVNLPTKSGASTSNGSAASQPPALGIGYLSSNFLTDPNGSIAWTKANLDAAFSGYEIAS